jgi:hypothetical protein
MTSPVRCHLNWRPNVKNYIKLGVSSLLITKRRARDRAHVPDLTLVKTYVVRGDAHSLRGGAGSLRRAPRTRTPTRAAVGRSCRSDLI